jgi:hypothetical protein
VGGGGGPEKGFGRSKSRRRERRESVPRDSSKLEVCVLRISMEYSNWGNEWVLVP